MDPVVFSNVAPQHSQNQNVGSALPKRGKVVPKRAI